jgi:antitoxin (DNA-binding transcriptional repressor) of toxin-antitoxin stability system
MKTASVRELQHHLKKILALVERGEEVQVLRRRKVVARLVAPAPVPRESPNFVLRARTIWGKKARGKALSAIVFEARGDR